MFVEFQDGFFLRPVSDPIREAGGFLKKSRFSTAKLMTDFGNMKKPSDTWLEEYFDLMDKAQGDSQRRRWTREEL
jgi:hypothetical protein